MHMSVIKLNKALLTTYNMPSQSAHNLQRHTIRNADFVPDGICGSLGELWSFQTGGVVAELGASFLLREGGAGRSAKRAVSEGRLRRPEGTTFCSADSPATAFAALSLPVASLPPWAEARAEPPWLTSCRAGTLLSAVDVTLLLALPPSRDSDCARDKAPNGEAAAVKLRGWCWPGWESQYAAPAAALFCIAFHSFKRALPVRPVTVLVPTPCADSPALHGAPSGTGGRGARGVTAGLRDLGPLQVMHT